MSTSLQLTLGFKLKDECTFNNYNATNNEEVVLVLKRAASGEDERVIYMHGPQGLGKTHLLQAVCHEAALQRKRCVYLPLKELVNLSPGVMMGLETLPVVCIDDVQAIAHVRAWEASLFHFYNRIYDAGGHLILSGNDMPKALALHLPDLVSRLSWGMVYALHPLSDHEKLNIFISRANDRGMYVSQDVAKYIMTHCDRQLDALMHILNVLDEASLAEHRRLTIPFVKEVLNV